MLEIKSQIDQVISEMEILMQREETSQKKIRQLETKIREEMDEMNRCRAEMQKKVESQEWQEEKLMELEENQKQYLEKVSPAKNRSTNSNLSWNR